MKRINIACTSHTDIHSGHCQLRLCRGFRRRQTREKHPPGTAYGIVPFPSSSSFKTRTHTYIWIGTTCPPGWARACITAPRPRPRPRLAQHTYIPQIPPRRPCGPKHARNNAQKEEKSMQTVRGGGEKKHRHLVSSPHPAPPLYLHFRRHTNIQGCPTEEVAV